MAETFTDNTGRFTGRAEAYTKYRSRYPKELLDFLAKTMPINSGDTILDMGSGTGILSELVLQSLHESLNVSVIGLEPNADMRGVQETSLKAWSDKGCFRSAVGTAEATTLDAQSVDAALAAAAFHWFDGPRTREEVLRVVKPRDGKGAPFALITSSRPEEEQVPPELARAKATRMALLGLRQHLGITHTAHAHGEKVGKEALDLFFGGESQWQEHKVHRVRKMTWDELRGIMHSFSVAPMEGTEAHDKLVEKLKPLFDEHQVDGVIENLETARIIHGYVR